MAAFQEDKTDDSENERLLREAQEECARLRADYSHRLASEREQYREKFHEMEKEIQQLNFTNNDAQRRAQEAMRELGLKNAEVEVLRKNLESVESRVTERVESDLKGKIDNLQRQLDMTNLDVERQVNLKLNERLQDEQILNENIIKY